MGKFLLLGIAALWALVGAVGALVLPFLGAFAFDDPRTGHGWAPVVLACGIASFPLACFTAAALAFVFRNEHRSWAYLSQLIPLFPIVAGRIAFTLMGQF